MVKKDKKKKVVKKDSTVFYVGLKEPINIRRSILEASKDLVQNIQRFDKFCAVRREKKEHIAQLKLLVNDISKYLAKLKNNLPTVPAPQPPPKPKPVPKPKVEKKEEKPVPKPKEEKLKLKPQEKSELHRLEAELNEIESKLGGL